MVASFTKRMFLCAVTVQLDGLQVAQALRLDFWRRLVGKDKTKKDITFFLVENEIQDELNSCWISFLSRVLGRRRTGQLTLFRTKDNKLGQGTFGHVYKSEFGGQHVAVKEIKITRPEQRAEAKNEIEILEQLTSDPQTAHPNIIKLIGYSTNPIHLKVGQTLYLVMEYFPGQDLKAYMAKQPVAVPALKAVEIMQKLSDALAYVHKQNIAHLDIKPANILVNEKGEVKLIDFGVARYCTDHQKYDGTMSRIVGTPRYLSPEVVKGVLGGLNEDAAKLLIDVRADVWSLGVVFCEMLTGRVLFYADGLPAVLADINRFQSLPDEERIERMFIDSPVNPDVQQIVKSMLVDLRHPRPSIETVNKKVNDLIEH